VVEHRASKCGALSSIPSTAKQKKINKKKKEKELSRACSFGDRQN
jgi:hypothetical protein